MAGNEEHDTDHHDFLQWALSNGFQINGVAPCRFPGRGMGMIATRTIEADEIMLNIPMSTMLTIDSIPEEFVDRFPPGTSIHAILAAFLTHGDTSFLQRWATWRKVWPSRREFQESLPILWAESSETTGPPFPPNQCKEQLLLPPSACDSWNSFSRVPDEGQHQDAYQSILVKQQKRLYDAWANVLSVFPNTDWDVFSYHWLILNTRSFYYLNEEKPPADWNDAIGLLPFADYLNHTDNAPCEVTYDGEMYTFKAKARHEKGDEIFMSYGPHHNDYLWVEYGFFLDQNGSDAVYLDDIIFQEFTADDKETLRSHDYYGHYEITSSGVSSRVETVASFKYMEREDWEAYVLDPSSSGHIPLQATELVRRWMKAYWVESLLAIQRLKEKADVLEKSSLAPGSERIAALLRRWIQIRDLCRSALDRIA
ncbi:Exosome-associated factor Rrp47/DNA strand repair C1D [Penicillium italicum]|uniref:Exosome-associated factor Rrp47/DNA strand repair C1D n=1 Tax=Penicillium italicum TaxID=40296 RepID=A0A0A2L252_PENIT|nr:Exosome-associated factor Rrp47/DNA strand repair C1D [Penicillium italicum]